MYWPFKFLLAILTAHIYPQLINHFHRVLSHSLVSFNYGYIFMNEGINTFSTGIISNDNCQQKKKLINNKWYFVLFVSFLIYDLCQICMNRIHNHIPEKWEMKFSGNFDWITMQSRFSTKNYIINGSTFFFVCVYFVLHASYSFAFFFLDFASTWMNAEHWLSHFHICIIWIIISCNMDALNK